MLYELAHTPMPAGYGEALLSLANCKEHLQIEADEDEFDTLIPFLRDAAIEFVERYCELRMGPVSGIVWHGEALPAGASQHIDLGVQMVTALTAIAWKDSAGAEVAGTVGDFRVSERGLLRPAVSKKWPTGIGGDVRVTFDAGYAAGECPAPLLAAVRRMLGHLFLNREATNVGTISGTAPLGVTALCQPFRVLRV